MKTLGIDSSTQTGSVSLVENGIIAAEYTLNVGNTHSTTLLPMIESLLKNCSLKYSDIDLYALAAGPGSFTGVRIGAATLKGLSFTRETPCIGISTLAAMAEAYKELSGIVFPVINARRGTVYTAAFCVDGTDACRIKDDDTVSEEELCEYIFNTELDKDVMYFTGDSAKSIISKLKEKKPGVKAFELSNRGAAGAALAAERLFVNANPAEKLAFSPDGLSPIYLKKPQAEREREERLKKREK